MFSNYVTQTSWPYESPKFAYQSVVLKFTKTCLYFNQLSQLNIVHLEFKQIKKKVMLLIT